MKYLKRFNESKSLIDSICKKYGITNYTVNPDGTVDVKGSVNLSHKNLTRLPLQFGKVSGDFYCNDNQLTTLEGCPTEVGRGFNCYNNQLTTLEGCPTSVGGAFNCQDNQLTTLEGGPTSVGGGFYCNHNPVYEIWDIIAVQSGGWDNEKMDFFNDLDIIRGEEIAIERLNFFLEEMGLPTVESVEGYKNIY